MNREEKLAFQKETEEYFESKRVYDLFEKLLKELVINKPEDPIDYLMDRLKKKDIKRIFVTGSAGSDRKEIALSLGMQTDYKCLSLGDLIQKEVDKKLDNCRKIEKRTATLNLVDDDTIIEILRKELIQLEKENISYIIEGFPRNRVNFKFNNRSKPCSSSKSVYFQIIYLFSKQAKRSLKKD
jgi:adenylate kinase